MQNEEVMEKLYDIIFGDYNVAVITGAGISRASGIPDFRSDEDGLYVKDPGLIDKIESSYFENHPKEFREAYIKVFMDKENLEPNVVHQVLAKLEERGLIHAIVTQNVDGLHQAAGSKNVIEIHGTNTFYCTKCNTEHTYNDYKYGYDVEDLENPGELKHVDGDVCRVCGGLVRPNTTLYNEQANPETMRKALQAMMKADKLIILGTSLTVGTVLGLISEFMRHKRGFRRQDIFIVNNNRTIVDSYAIKCSDDLEQVFKLVKVRNKEKN